MVSFPYYSHTTPIRIPKDMGIVWEAYHKGVPLLGVPENPIECGGPDCRVLTCNLARFGKLGEVGNSAMFSEHEKRRERTL